MSTLQQVITIAILAAVTFMTRALPFLIFSRDKKTPKYIQYLGSVLPLAVFGMLVVYCLKDVEWMQGVHGIPEVLGILSTILIHVWRRQLFLSIATGTIVYMILIRVILP